MERLVAHVVAGVCALEVAAIEGKAHNVPVLRRVPTVSHASSRCIPVGTAVLGGLAVHFWLARLLAWLARRRPAT